MVNRFYKIINYFLFIVIILLASVSCSKNDDDGILENVITKKVDFSLIDFNSFPANPKFLSCFSKEGFHFLSFPDGGVYRNLFSKEMEIYVPNYEGNENYNEYRIRIVNSYILNEQEKYDELLILPKLKNILGDYNYEPVDLHFFSEKTSSKVEINSELPMWNLSDRKVYLYGSNVEHNNNEKERFLDVCIIIKMK